MTIAVYECAQFEFQHERFQFDDAAKCLYNYYCGNLQEQAVFIGNIAYKDLCLDGLIIKNDAIIIVEFKNYEGDLKMSRNKHWICSDEEVHGGSNGKTVFDQIYKNRKRLFNYLKNTRLLRESQIQDIKGLIVFSKLGSVDYGDLDHKIRTWLFATDIDGFAGKVRSLCSGHYQPHLNTPISVTRISNDEIWNFVRKTKIQESWLITDYSTTALMPTDLFSKEAPHNGRSLSTYDELLKKRDEADRYLKDYLNYKNLYDKLLKENQILKQKCEKEAKKAEKSNKQLSKLKDDNRQLKHKLDGASKELALLQSKIPKLKKIALEKPQSLGSKLAMPAFEDDHAQQAGLGHGGSLDRLDEELGLFDGIEKGLEGRAQNPGAALDAKESTAQSTEDKSSASSLQNEPEKPALEPAKAACDALQEAADGACDDAMPTLQPIEMSIKKALPPALPAWLLQDFLVEPELMPPKVPALKIDEHGNPYQKQDLYEILAKDFIDQRPKKLITCLGAGKNEPDESGKNNKKAIKARVKAQPKERDAPQTALPAPAAKSKPGTPCCVRPEADPNFCDPYLLTDGSRPDGSYLGYDIRMPVTNPNPYRKIADRYIHTGRAGLLIKADEPFFLRFAPCNLFAVLRTAAYSYSRECLLYTEPKILLSFLHNSCGDIFIRLHNMLWYLENAKPENFNPVSRACLAIFKQQGIFKVTPLPPGFKQALTEPLLPPPDLL